MTAFRRTPAVLMAAFSHLHEWLPGIRNRNYNDLAPALSKANIARIAFLRHGQTAPSQGEDFDRVLTDVGREQCREAGSSFGRDLKPFYSPLLVSPAPRTIETANIFRKAADETTVGLEPIPVLYDGTMQPRGRPLFKELGYAPLKEYLNHKDEKFREDARHVLGEYAHAVVESIMDVVEKDTIDVPTNSTLWVVGHAIYLPAAALGVACAVSCHGQDIILSTNTRESEGFLIDINGASIRCIERPSQQQKR